MLEVCSSITSIPGPGWQAGKVSWEPSSSPPPYYPCTVEGVILFPFWLDSVQMVLPDAETKLRWRAPCSDSQAYS